MWLQQIEMKNFKPYKENTIIKFDIECLKKGKNVFIIYGDNGFGKTSILDAVYWGLYGSMIQQTKILFNDKVRNENNAEMKVILTFRDEELNKTYKIIRIATKLKRNIREKLNVLEDGVSLGNDELDLQDVIEERILPRNISKFFFFNAEDVKNLAIQQGGEAVKESVELLLGLKAIREAINDLKLIRQDFEKKQKKILENMEKYEEISKKYENINASIIATNNEIDSLQNTLRNKKELYRKLREELAESNVREIKNLEYRREKLEEKLRNLEIEKSSLEKKLEEISSNVYKYILYDELASAKEDIRQKIIKLTNRLKELREIKYEVDIIEQSLDERKCKICGNYIIESTYEELKEKMNKIKNDFPKINDEISKIEDEYAKYRDIYAQLENEIKKISILRQDISNIYIIRNKIYEIENEIREINKDLNNISNNLQNLGISIVAATENKISKLKDEINDIEQKIHTLKDNLRNLEYEKKKIEKQIKELSIKNSQLDDIVKRIELIDNLIRIFEEYLEKSINMRRKDLINYSSKIFLELTNKKEEYKGFEFSSKNNYKFQIVCKDGTKPDMATISYGEMEVVALSFILGLNKYSQIKAPIITDTLFGRLSPYVQENIAKLFTEMDNQVILLVLKDNRPNGRTEIDSIASIIKDHVCKEYVILRDQIKRESKIVEEKILLK